MANLGDGGSLRPLIRAAHFIIRAARFIIPLIFACLIVVVIVSAKPISGAISGNIVLFTTIYLLLFSGFWASSGYLENKILDDIISGRDSSKSDQNFENMVQKFRFLFNVIGGIFLIILVIAILFMFLVDTNWVYLLLIFIIYTIIDLLSWQARRWFLEDLISYSPPAKTYYIRRPHIRRLILQCAVPLLLLAIVLFCGDKGIYDVLRHLGSDLKTALLHFSRVSDIDPPSGINTTSIESEFRTFAYGAFLTCATYSEAVIAGWRRKMKLRLSMNLAAAILWDEVTKTVLYFFFVLSLVVVIVSGFFIIAENYNWLMQHLSFLVKSDILAAATAILSVIVVACAAYGFKYYSRVLYGLSEIVFGGVSVYYIIVNVSADPDSAAKLIGGLFVLIRGVENAWEGSGKTYLGVRDLVTNFGRARLFQLNFSRHCGLGSTPLSIWSGYR